MVSQFSDLTIEDIMTKLEQLRHSDKKKYTAKDKVLFEKILMMRDKNKEFESKLQETEANEKITKELIGFKFILFIIIYYR